MLYKIMFNSTDVAIILQRDTCLANIKKSRRKGSQSILNKKVQFGVSVQAEIA